MVILTLQNNHYLVIMVIMAFYGADSLDSSKKCATFAVTFNFCVFLES